MQPFAEHRRQAFRSLRIDSAAALGKIDHGMLLTGFVLKNRVLLNDRAATGT